MSASLALSELSEAERFLQEFHRRHPGATSALFGRAGAGAGGSSYDGLADVVPAGSGPITVLDLACGDGFLLEALSARRQPGLHLIGVDMSDAELDAARRRLPARAATLLPGRAQAIPL